MSDNDIQKQLTKLRRNKKFLWFGILFLVLVILWILASIFATTKTSTISQELRDLSQAFVPRLESKVFDEITVKRVFDQQELSTFPIYVLDKNSVDGTTSLIDITNLDDFASIDEDVSTAENVPTDENVPVDLSIPEEASLSSQDQATTL